MNTAQIARRNQETAELTAIRRKLHTSTISITPKDGGGSTIVMRPGEGRSFGNCVINLR